MSAGACISDYGVIANTKIDRAITTSTSTEAEKFQRSKWTHWTLISAIDNRVI